VPGSRPASELASKPQPSPLYRRVLGGAAFERLPAPVRALHSVTQTTTWVGTADVSRGTSPASRLIVTVFGLPPAGNNQPLAVTFTPDVRGAETWDRAFGARRFVSVQSDAGGGVIAERVGLVTLYLRPIADAATLRLRLERVTVLGLSLPQRLLPHVATSETAVDGRYHFDVEARLPLVGLLVRYTGSLAPKP
jgi:Domain of unknown function (DUF4166)